MRTEIVDYLTANAVKGFTVSTELPWDSSGEPLYLKNFKRIYVDRDQVVQEPLFDTLNARGVINQITTSRVFVAADAKNPPSTLDTLVAMIQNARLDSDITGVTQRVTQTSSEFVRDAIVYEFDISFRQLVVNT